VEIRAKVKPPARSGTCSIHGLVVGKLLLEQIYERHNKFKQNEQPYADRKDKHQCAGNVEL